MTCAHVVNVALTKIAGVETVEVSLTRALATVKLKPGNGVSLAQLVRTVREKGYTLPLASIVVSGVPVLRADGWVLRIASSGESIPLVEDPQSPSAYEYIPLRAGETTTVRGRMALAKNGKVGLLMVNQVR